MGTSTGQRRVGGANGAGTVFKISPSGTLTTLYSFCPQSGCTDGALPYAGLLQAPNGDFYGTTAYGGASACSFALGCGTVFKVSPSGTLTTLYRFCARSGCADGYYPNAGLVQATNGDLYGTTVVGGANGNYGTVFKITPSGTLTTVYSFCAQSGCTDGSEPYAGLIQATNGDLYGTTYELGANGFGTVFKITPGGTLTTVYSFCAQTACSDGIAFARLIQAANGELYGTTNFGGNFNCPSYGCGTIFKVTPTGTLTTL